MPPSPGNRDDEWRPERVGFPRALGTRRRRLVLTGLVLFAGLLLVQVILSRDGSTDTTAAASPRTTDAIAMLTSDRPEELWSRPSALRDRSVLVVGDSLLKAAVTRLRVSLLLTGATDVTIAAQNGSTIGWAADQIIEHSGHDVVVVAAGTNNVVDGWNRRDVRQTDRALQMLSTAECPIWVAPTAWRHPVEDGVRRTRVDATSLVALLSLRDQIDPQPIHVADWGLLAPELGELHHQDGIHHLVEGSTTYARFITATILQHCTDTWTEELVPSRD